MDPNKTILAGGVSWHEEDNGTWTKVFSCIYKNGSRDYEVLEQNVPSVEYFKRKLSGTD